MSPASSTLTICSLEVGPLTCKGACSGCCSIYASANCSLLNTHIRGRPPPSGKRLIGASPLRGATTIQYRPDIPQRIVDVNLAPLQSRLTASPTPAKQICAQAAHYGTDHSSDNETPGVHRTTPSTKIFANETHFGLPLPEPPPLWRRQPRAPESKKRGRGRVGRYRDPRP
jgi:hypothetical protein